MERRVSSLNNLASLRLARFEVPHTRFACTLALQDWSYMDGRPLDFIKGQHEEHGLPLSVTEGGLAGMREGGWRRLVVPNAYGATGLRRQTPVRGGGHYQAPAAGFVIKPGAFAWVDVIMVDGGSGRCEGVLNPLGVPPERANRLRSLTCLPGEVSERFSMAGGVGK